MQKDNIISLLNDVLNNINDSIIIFTPLDKKLIYANKSALAVFGYSFEEITKKCINELFYDSLINYDELTDDKTNKIKFNQSCLNKNGSIFYNDIRISGINKNEGYYTVYTLKNSNIELASDIKNAALELSMNAMCLMDRKNRIIYINQAAENILGYKKSEILKMNYEKFLIKNRNYRNMIDELTRNGQCTAEIKALNKSGKTIDLLISISIYNKSGINESIATFIDISKSKNIESELTIFKKYAEASSQGFRISTLDGYMIYANPVLCRLLNVENAAAAYGRSIYEFITEDADNDIKKNITDALKKEGSWKGELKYRLSENDSIPVIDNFFIIYNDDGKPEYLADVVTDISEIKDLQEQLIQSEKLSAIGQLAAGVAHEFNNILAVIKSTSQMLLYYNDNGKMPLPPEIINEIGNIDQQTVRGAKIVSNLMTLVKPKRKNMELCMITEIIDEVILMQQKELDLENISIMRDYSEIPFIKADKVMIHQIFLNLLINSRHAVKFAGRGIISVNVKCESGLIIINFKDNGAGMDEDIRSKIFNPFFTTKGAYAKNNLGIKGMGLGLSVVLKIIKDLKGTINVESSPGKGTEFIIKLSVK